MCVCVYFRPLQMLQHWRSHVSTFNFWGQVVDFWESLRSMIGGSELPEVMKKGFWYRKNWGNWEEWVNLTTIAMAIVLEEPRCKSAVFQSLLVKLVAPFWVKSLLPWCTLGWVSWKTSGHVLKLSKVQLYTLDICKVPPWLYPYHPCMVDMVYLAASGWILW